MNKIAVILSTFLFCISCSYNQIDWRGMDEAEKAANERASQNLVAFMSLNTMFPDPKVRALAKAAGEGRVDKIDQLVKEGVDVNARGRRNATPLFWAMRNIKGFTRLLELGADPNVIYDDGGSVMHWAVEHEDVNFLKAALKHGGNPNLIAGGFKEPLLCKATSPEGKNKAAILLDAGADINGRSVFLSGQTAIMLAAGLGQYDFVYELLERGADYTLKDDNGMDLSDHIASNRKRMDPHNELYKWMEKVTDWLNERGVSIN